MRQSPGKRRSVIGAAVAACACLPALAAPAVPGMAAMTASRTAQHRAGRPALSPGRNLLANPGGTTGAVSARGWDAVTIPGWQVRSGLPTVVRYGTPRFPTATAPGPGLRRGSLFAGGAGGTARLAQSVSLQSPAGRTVPAGAHYLISAWLGGTRTSHASMLVAFLSRSGRVLAARRIGPVGGSAAQPRAVLRYRSATGALPPGTASARVTLVLATSLKNVDGPDAPLVGYDRAVAGDLSFSVSVPVRRPPPLRPPAAHVPRFDHVFLFYFENEDYKSIIGNRRQAPYLNSLLPRATLLARFFAEEHPSDGNYLALAGGSTFGIPLDDPLEENPQYTIKARNIGDLLVAAHRTWKEYLQSANGPCDDTVHGYYWNDDLPMTYFADVRGRPGYCSSHLVPLESLQRDLASTATTPSFAWIGANDCSDMEGCGIRAGDRFLARELGAIMRSAAWRTQRSLAIITFDEDGYDHEHPAQRVPTLLLGSSGVREGYVSRVRYTHYSLLRTIEAALGLGSLTRNDRYAAPVDDAFAKVPAGSGLRPGARGDRGRHLAGHTSPAGHAGPAGPAGPAASAPACPAARTTRPATPAERTHAPGTRPAALPRRQVALVVNSASASVTPVSLATRKPGPPIRVGADPSAIAITPGGSTAYVANSGSGTVTPITIATGTPGRPIRVGADPRAIAISPDGSTAYVANSGSGTVTPITIATGTPGRPIRVGAYPLAIAFSPDGRTAFVASYGSDSVTPISLATCRPGPAIPAGMAPDALAVRPDGRMLYVVDGDSDAVTAISPATRRPGMRIPVGYSPAAVAMAPSGRTAYVVNTISGTVTPVSTSTGRPGRPISVGLYSYPLAIALYRTGTRAVVLDTYAGQVSIINTRTGHAYKPVRVGSLPAAVAIAG